MSFFEPNPDFVDELEADPDTVSCMEGFANAALEGARAASPSKTFSDRLSVETDGDQVALVSDWSIWGIIEYGSVNNPPYAPMRQGLQAAGLQMTDDGSTA